MEVLIQLTLLGKLVILGLHWKEEAIGSKVWTPVWISYLLTSELIPFALIVLGLF